MGYPMILDPEIRRVLLEEIAHQRSRRSRYRALGGEFLQGRADCCDYTIRAIRDVWARLVSVERRRAEDALLALDPGDWSPGEVAPSGASESELRYLWGDR